MCCLSENAGEVNRTKHTLIENSTSPISEHGTKKVMTYINNHMDSLKRGMYVFLGVTIIVALYFGIRVYRYMKLFNNCIYTSLLNSYLKICFY